MTHHLKEKADHKSRTPLDALSLSIRQLRVKSVKCMCSLSILIAFEFVCHLLTDDKAVSPGLQ